MVNTLPPELAELAVPDPAGVFPGKKVIVQTMCEGMDEEQVTFMLDVCVPEAYWPISRPRRPLRAAPPGTADLVEAAAQSQSVTGTGGVGCRTPVARTSSRSTLGILDDHAPARAGKHAQRDPQPVGDFQTASVTTCTIFRHRSQGRDHRRGSAAVFRGGLRLRGEHERLAVLEANYDPGTFRLLEDCGVAPGWRCAEVGAGRGSVAAWLADAVGPEGSVVALRHRHLASRSSRASVERRGAPARHRRRAHRRRELRPRAHAAGHRAPSRAGAPARDAGERHTPGRRPRRRVHGHARHGGRRSVRSPEPYLRRVHGDVIRGRRVDEHVRLRLRAAAPAAVRRAWLRRER